jgi:hypothetical protein
VNAWSGIEWEVDEIRVESVQISDVKMPVRHVTSSSRPLRISGSKNVSELDLFIELACGESELPEALAKDPAILLELDRGAKSIPVELRIFGIRVYSRVAGVRTAILQWQDVTPLGSERALVFRTSIAAAAFRGIEASATIAVDGPQLPVPTLSDAVAAGRHSGGDTA